MKIRIKCFCGHLSHIYSISSAVTFSLIHHANCQHHLSASENELHAIEAGKKTRLKWVTRSLGRIYDSTFEKATLPVCIARRRTERNKLRRNTIVEKAITHSPCACREKKTRNEKCRRSIYLDAIAQTCVKKSDR